MMLPSIKITQKASSTTATTASQRGTRWFCSIRTGGASMKLKMQASAMGRSTSRARYKVATTMTAISMELSVDDDEFTADPPSTMRRAAERKLLQNRIAVLLAPLRRFHA